MKSGRPLVWSSSMCTVIRGSRLNAGSSGATGWSSPSFPSPTNCRITEAVKVLEMEASAKPVPVVTGRLAATSARPEAPAHAAPLSQTMATETPGTCNAARTFSRAFWSCAARTRSVSARSVTGGELGHPGGSDAGIMPGLTVGNAVGRGVAAADGVGVNVEAGPGDADTTAVSVGPALCSAAAAPVRPPKGSTRVATATAPTDTVAATTSRTAASTCGRRRCERRRACLRIR